jgi:predicted enzyme related to lactoylglutathione lyase
VLETDDFPPAKQAKSILFEAGFPVTVLTTDDIDADYQRLKDLGVIFRGEPRKTGAVSTVSFEDSCGNLINLVQPHASKAT